MFHLNTWSFQVLPSSTRWVFKWTPSVLINTQSGPPQSFLNTNYKEIVPFFGFQLICSLHAYAFQMWWWIILNHWIKCLIAILELHTVYPSIPFHILTVVLRSLQVLHNWEKVSQLKRKVADKSRDATETSNAKGVSISEIKAAITALLRHDLLKARKFQYLVN